MAQLWYDTKISPAAIVANQELALTLGAKNIVFLTAAGAFSFFGIAQAGGNVDGTIVTLCNITNASVAFTTKHESSSASSAVNRFWNSSRVDVTWGTGVGAITYRYDSSILRWHMIARSQ